MSGHEVELGLLRAKVAREDVRPLDAPGTTGWLQRMCRVATRDLPAAGVSVSVLSDQGDLLTVAGSGAASTLVDELQFTLGEGPCLAAYEQRRPVLVPDLAVTGCVRWPVYARTALELGVGAVFAFPLQVGVARLGAMDVYRSRAGHLSDPALTRALSYADVAMEQLLDARVGIDDTELGGDMGATTRFEVYQAQGMVMIQLRVGAAEALARLRAHAFAHGRPLAEVAQAVLDHKLVLEDDR